MLDCWDNACSETLFGSLKVERLYGTGFDTCRRTRDEVIDTLAWYNSRKLHSTPGYTSPMQHEQRWLADQPKTANL